MCINTSFPIASSSIDGNARVTTSNYVNIIPVSPTDGIFESLLTKRSIDVLVEVDNSIKDSKDTKHSKEDLINLAKALQAARKKFYDTTNEKNRNKVDKCKKHLQQYAENMAKDREEDHIKQRSSIIKTVASYFIPHNHFYDKLRDLNFRGDTTVFKNFTDRVEKIKIEKTRKKLENTPIFEKITKIVAVASESADNLIGTLETEGILLTEGLKAEIDAKEFNNQIANFFAKNEVACSKFLNSLQKAEQRDIKEARGMSGGIDNPTY